MCIYILDVLRFYVCHIQGFFHRQESSFSILRRSGLVVRIAGIAITGKVSMGRFPLMAGGRF